MALEQFAGGLRYRHRPQLHFGCPQKIHQRHDIAHGAVAGTALQIMPLDNAIETVAAMLGIKLARKLDRAKHLLPQIYADALEFVFKKTMIKADIVRTQHGALEIVQQLARHLLKARGGGHHVMVYAG